MPACWNWLPAQSDSRLPISTDPRGIPCVSLSLTDLAWGASNEVWKMAVRLWARDIVTITTGRRGGALHERLTSGQ
jgi:hypothetical protein